MYKDMNGKTRSEDVIINAEESREFWNGIHGKSKVHNGDAEWLKEIKQASCNQQERLIITEEMVSNQSKKIPNWKALGRDCYRGIG